MGVSARPTLGGVSAVPTPLSLFGSILWRRDGGQGFIAAPPPIGGIGLSLFQPLSKRESHILA